MSDFEDQLPDDDIGSNELDGLTVNFTSDEAESKARKPIPRGKYHVKITDGEVSYSKSERNPGKPYWHMEYTVQEGQYEGRKVWGNIMLWNGALYSLSQLMKALGQDIESGSFKVPDVNSLIGSDLMINVKVKPETDQYDASNDVRGYEEYTGKIAAEGDAALLP